MTAAPVLIPSPGLLTPEKFFEHEGYRGHELIDGQIVEKSMGAEADFVSGQMLCDVNNYLRKNPIARAFGPETGYECFAKAQRPQLRKPDVSIVLTERLPEGKLPLGYFKIRPDIVFESVSTHDKALDLERKLLQFHGAGVPLIWVVYPRVRTGRVLRPDGSMKLLREQDSFDGGDLLPGLSVPLVNILPKPEEQHPMPDKEEDETKEE